MRTTLANQLRINELQIDEFVGKTKEKRAQNLCHTNVQQLSDTFEQPIAITRGSSSDVDKASWPQYGHKAKCKYAESSGRLTLLKALD